MARKDRVPYHSAEGIEKIRAASRAAHKGKVISEETKQKMREAKLGKKRSPEAREAISRGKTGKKRKPFSEEHKARLRASHLARWAKWREEQNQNPT